MAVDWENKYDAETEGTLPDDWHKDTGETPVNLEVDDVKSYSSPHSMFQNKDTSPAYSYAVTNTGVFTVTDNRKCRGRFWSDGGGIHWMQSADQDGGDFDYLKTAVLICIDDSSGTNTGTAYGIGYFNGSAFVDTGYTFNASAWNLLEWTHDFTGNDFDLWVNGTAAGTNLSFRENQTQIRALCTYTDDEVWFDDFRVGEPDGWDGGAPPTAGSMFGVG